MFETWEKQGNDRPAWCQAVRQVVKTGEQEGNCSPEKTKEKREQKPAIPAIPPCLHEVQQRLQIASRPLQPLAQLPTTVMLYTIVSRRPTDADGGGWTWPGKEIE